MNITSSIFPTMPGIILFLLYTASFLVAWWIGALVIMGGPTKAESKAFIAKLKKEGKIRR